MNTHTNKIPKPLTKVISLGVTALTGAEAIGEDLPLKLNTAPDIAADIYDLMGNPATPLIPGKQPKYVAQKAAVPAAYAAARVAVAAGRAYCSAAIGVLRPVLGNRWNSQWSAAGFVTPSLAIPAADPVPMLMGFRNYFNANPAQEVAARNVTAVIAQARITEIQQANLAVAQARDLLIDRKKDRDAALQVLRARLSGLRSELDQVLEDDDGRWYEFGFIRPIDSRMPAAVTGVVITPYGAGAVSVTWNASPLAENYRVSWRNVASGVAPTEVGLFTDRQCMISGLPTGATVAIGVTARNDSGETAATEVSIVVP